MPYAHQDQVGRGEHYCPNVCDLFRVLSRADRSCIHCQKVLGGFLLVRVSLSHALSIEVKHGWRSEGEPEVMYDLAVVNVCTIA